MNGMAAYLSHYNLTWDEGNIWISVKRSLSQTILCVSWTMSRYSDSAVNFEITAYLLIFHNTWFPSKNPNSLYIKPPINRWSFPIYIQKVNNMFMTQSEYKSHLHGAHFKCRSTRTMASQWLVHGLDNNLLTILTEYKISSLVIVRQSNIHKFHVLS